MIVLLVLAVVCVVLIGLLLPKNRTGRKDGSRSIVWRGGRRELTEEAAAKMVLDRLRDRD